MRVKLEDKGDAFRNVIKSNFCLNPEIASSIVGCSYVTKDWCPKTCKYTSPKFAEYRDVSLKKIEEDLDKEK